MRTGPSEDQVFLAPSRRVMCNSGPSDGPRERRPRRRRLSDPLEARRVHRADLTRGCSLAAARVAGDADARWGAARVHPAARRARRLSATAARADALVTNVAAAVEPETRRGAADRRAPATAADGARHRPGLPRTSLGAAASRRPAGARSAGLAPARQPAGPAPAAVGDAPDRGPGSRSLRHLPEDPSHPDRRRQRDADDPARALRQPARSRHARLLDRRSRELIERLLQRRPSSPAPPTGSSGRGRKLARRVHPHGDRLRARGAERRSATGAVHLARVGARRPHPGTAQVRHPAV